MLQCHSNKIFRKYYMKPYIKKNSVIIVIMYNYPFTLISPQISLLKKARTNTLTLQLAYHRAKYHSQSCVVEHIMSSGSPHSFGFTASLCFSEKKTPNIWDYMQKKIVFHGSLTGWCVSLTTEFCNLEYLFASLQSPGKRNSLKMVRGEKKHLIHF